MASGPGDQRSRFAALQDRAYAFVAEHQPVAESALLAHTYGGVPPPALHAQLVAPLLDDPRLERHADSSWALVGCRPAVEPGGLPIAALTTLALATSGAHPARGRVVGVAAEHLQAGMVVERFTAMLNPGGRVPGYVAARLGVAPALFDELPSFASIADDLLDFLGARPIVAQDVRLTWAFLESETRRIDRVVLQPLLVDANDIATRLLALEGKPSLALVAARLGIGAVRIGRPAEEARVLGLVMTHLLKLADQQGFLSWDGLLERRGGTDTPSPLQRGQTARALPEEPGVYVLRDAEQTPLYIGKARRLRSRMQAYVHRPLGATRRLEGLVGAVDAVDSIVCATDLEALVLEDREIRRLQPRFNTVRRQRAPRVWIRLPPTPVQRSGRRQAAPRRLEASLGPADADGDFVGPFRTETLAAQARLLAREVFDLDNLRREDLEEYETRLQLAWEFLGARCPGGTPSAEAFARQRSSRVLRAVLAFDPDSMLLPADPRQARYAVVRPGLAGIEGFLIDRGVFSGWCVLEHDFEDFDASRFVAELLADSTPRTDPLDVDVVLRWLGAQRPPAQLVHLPSDTLAAADAIEDAVSALLDRFRDA